MAKLNVFHYMSDLKNVNEQRVWDMLSDYIDNNETSSKCLCGLCLVDIAAITLNNIPSHYQMESQITAAQEKVSDAEIYRQLKKAIAMVKARPHH